MSQSGRLQKLALAAAAGSIALYGAVRYGDSDAGSQPGSEAARAPLQTQSARVVGGPFIRARPQPVLMPSARENLAAEPTGDPFAPLNWLPPPAPPVPPKLVVAEPPQAPPLPYRFVGMLEDRAKPAAFLARGAELLIVSAGDTIQGEYRVDKLSSQDISLTYLPLNQRQEIRIVGE